MTMEVLINTPLCDHKHKIKVEGDEESVSVSIDSTCNHLGEEVNFTKVELLKSDVFYEKMEEFMPPRCIPQCFLPVLISNISRSQLGLISKTKINEISSFVEVEFQ